MKPASNNSEQQFALRFRAGAGLPFAISQRRICRAARRAFLSYPGEAKQWSLRAYLEDVALLLELRRAYRRTLASWRRTGRKASAAAFACTPAGRRAHRTIEALSFRIAREHANLCG